MCIYKIQHDDNLWGILSQFNQIYNDGVNYYYCIYEKSQCTGAEIVYSDSYGYDMILVDKWLIIPNVEDQQFCQSEGGLWIQNFPPSETFVSANITNTAQAYIDIANTNSASTFIAYTNIASANNASTDVASTSIAKTKLYTVTPIFIPTEITDTNGVQMALVPAGEFVMGTANGDSNESPAHKVYLDSFYIDVTEVTNAAYKLCVDARVCPLPVNEKFYRETKYANYPVVYVSWNNAKRYCEWAGQRLPTESEWEKAARGTDSRVYPWGNGIDCNKANYSRCFQKGELSPVGFYANFSSPYGVLDMVGNVWEWVSDWYSDSYYKISPYKNPQGPDKGEFHSLRGGSFETGADDVRSDKRSHGDSSDKPNYKIGFRCVLPIP